MCNIQWISPFLFITRIHSDFLLSKQIGQLTKNACLTSGNYVCSVYRFLVHRDEGCGAVYDLVIVLYINHSVYLQCSESLQPVAWDYGLRSYLEFKQCQNWDTVQVFHDRNHGLYDHSQR